MFSNILDLFQTQKKGWAGPVLGVKQANENRRNFDKDVLKEIKPRYIGSHSMSIILLHGLLFIIFDFFFILNFNNS